MTPYIVILSTGSELTAGRSVDTNSGWIANQLFELGWKVKKIITLPDDPNLIFKELEALQSLAKEIPVLAIMTGGLGPTEDDYTLETVLKLTGKTSYAVEKAKIRLTKIYEARGKDYKDILPTVFRQTNVPEGCKTLDNSVGIAVGFIESLGENSYLVCMPGVPSEMTEMFKRRLVPELKKMYPRENLIQKTKWLWNIGESLFQNEFIEPNREVYFKETEWGVTANRGYIKCIFQSTNDVMLDTILKSLEKQYPDLISDDVFQYVHEQLLYEKWTISVVESCTGGLLGKKLTERAGSSAYFMGGFLTYSNEMKSNLLGIPKETIETFGAVSDEVAFAMVDGLCLKTGTDFGVSITGIAGPEGGSEEKPVGTVCIGLKEPNGKIKVHRYLFPGNRESIRENASNTALFLIYQSLKGKVV
ncbi:CinA-related protein [Leptospira biflexa serovar Patoc strain 'Patoc 1 (Ames)']|uniref:CinA-like protein n=2 Tax=Leptospira biflexa serovar Patoc TaxID=145259 RepID=CINAL_LEPBP|nr:nicotinamide-nucleotide amidohydrolase family protein [Leptospira biflexa]B0SB28.1 RecName: Full=CinA-like protein [Leptospira biflexa serovar Patoc strain 'Patoc 1 (Ames)']B0SSV0.1 RecName: Full=CinA-like protein [Leptospira biflexa serovar Patoc strain 'Patoc 1 (Paris)']ABZ94534.1 CinA-related protein [Leptospira biflexa serovar Patoc strain 'Patoc 1 (Ames)']ABZ98190.1 Competence-damage inducible protein CinA [Leptospira biflexa serovar Patoc strain 'Patoc 1 (Paris)']